MPTKLLVREKLLSLNVETEAILEVAQEK